MGAGGSKDGEKKQKKTKSSKEEEVKNGKVVKYVAVFGV